MKEQNLLTGYRQRHVSQNQHIARNRIIVRRGQTFDNTRGRVGQPAVNSRSNQPQVGRERPERTRFRNEDGSHPVAGNRREGREQRLHKLRRAQAMNIGCRNVNRRRHEVGRPISRAKRLAVCDGKVNSRNR